MDDTRNKEHVELISEARVKQVHAYAYDHAHSYSLLHDTNDFNTVIKKIKEKNLLGMKPRMSMRRTTVDPYILFEN
jgi:hypothetical protein